GRACARALLPHNPSSPPPTVPELAGPFGFSLPTRACQPTHQNSSACAALSARVFIGLGDGWLAESGGEPTADDVASHVDEISATEPFTVPSSIFDEVADVCERLGIAG